MNVQFHHLARRGWFQDAYCSSMLLRFITTIGLTSNAVRAQQQLPIEIMLDRPVAIAVWELAETKLPTSDTFVHGGPAGAPPIVEHTLREFTLPHAHYLVLRTPLVIDGFNSGREAAAARLDTAVGLLGMHMARRFVHKVILDCELSGSGDWRHSAEVTISPEVHGPNIHSTVWRDLRQVAERLESQHTAAEVRQKVLLAIEFVGRAMQAAEPFSQYWTAFELLSRGSQGAKAQLSKAYGLKTPQHVDHVTGFKLVASMRHGMVHHGRRVELDAVMERYIQLLLVDLVQFNLGLGSFGHALAFQGTPGLPLERIGVPADWMDAFQKYRLPDWGFLDPG